MDELKVKQYESPATVKVQVEMEEGFMRASGEKQKKENVKIEAESHESGGTIDVSTSEWN